MSDVTRKRARSDDEDDEMYDPNGPESTLPPHLMGSATDFSNDKVDEAMDDYEPPHQSGGIPTGPASRRPTQIPSGPSFGGFSKGEYSGMKKRQRNMNMSKEIEIANDLCLSIFNFGDVPYELKYLFKTNLETISNYWSDDDFNTSLKQYLASVSLEMNHKNIIMSGFIILSNYKNSKIGLDLIEFFKGKVMEVFDSMTSTDTNDIDGKDLNLAKSWNRIILTIRMFALLLPIIEDANSIFAFVSQLLEFAVKLQDVNESRSPLGELLFYETVISLPYFLINEPENESVKQELMKILEIAKKFNIIDTDDNCKPVNDDKICLNYTTLLKNVVNLTENYLNDMRLFYNIREIIDPMIEEIKTTREEDVEMKKHEIGEIKLPDFEFVQKHENLDEFANLSDKLWKNPRYIIQIFHNERIRNDLEFETLPQHLTYESMILNDIIKDLLNNLEYNRIILSKQILNFQRYFNEKLFCKSNSPIDKLMIINDLNKGIDFDLIKNLEDNTDFEERVKYQMITSAKRIQSEFEVGFKSTWKMEEIVLENIINRIFNLKEESEEDLPLIYFESLLVDTCGRDWALSKKSQLQGVDNLYFSKLIGDSIRFLYNNIEKMEFENIIKFVKWFLFQISNFKFEWDWNEWISDLIQMGNELQYSPKIFFIRNLIHKEVLITNYKFIRDRTLNEDLKKFINLSINSREELVKFDSQFFGEDFASKFTVEPFENETVSTVDNQYVENPNGGNAYETNTDVYKLFQHYLFNHDEHAYNELCRDIYMNLENNEESEESFVELCEKLQERLNGDGMIENSDKYLITLVVESICLIGSRSFSVFEESLNKVFGHKLRKVLKLVDLSGDVKQECIIRAVLRIWNNEPRIGLMIINILSNYGSESDDTEQEGATVLDKKQVITVMWNLKQGTTGEMTSTGALLPLSELYIDEMISDMIEYGDDEDGEVVARERVELIKWNIQEALEKLVEVYDDKYIDVELNEESSDAEWKVKNLIGYIKMKIRKHGSHVDMEEFLLSGPAKHLSALIHYLLK